MNYKPDKTSLLVSGISLIAGAKANNQEKKWRLYQLYGVFLIFYFFLFFWRGWSGPRGELRVEKGLLISGSQFYKRLILCSTHDNNKILNRRGNAH